MCLVTIEDPVKWIIDFSLGDGGLYYATNADNPFFQVTHSTHQLAYALHKKQILDSLDFATSYGVHKRPDGREQIIVRTRSNDRRLKTARKYLYNKKIKTIDRALLRQLDARTLAYWFMDDGCSVNQVRKVNQRYVFHYEHPFVDRYNLATHSFSYSENTLIAEWLKERFSIDCIVSKHRDKFCINVTRVESKERFRDVIAPYVHESLAYKIQHPVSVAGIPYIRTEKVNQQ